MSGFPKVILVFLPVDWPFFMRRKMVEALAESVRRLGSVVAAVNRPLCPLSTIIRKPGRIGELFTQAPLQRLSSNLYLYSPKYWLHDSVARGFRGIEAMNLTALRKSYAGLCRRISVTESNPIVWFYYPQQSYVTRLFSGSFNIYEIYDNLTDYRGVIDSGREADLPSLSKHTSLLLTTSRKLHEKYSPLFQRSYRFGNGIDRETYDRMTAEVTHIANQVAAIPRPRLGYTGLVSQRIDWGLVIEIARLRPDWNLVFVGKVFDESSDLIRNARSQRNICFVGHLDHALMPSVLAGFDVGIMPYNDNDFFRYSNPLKIYEYAAAGLPTVSSNMEELSEYPRELVRICRDNPADWIAGIEECLRLDGSSVRKLGAKFASNFIWKDMTDKLIDEIERLI
jgi:glycosyltransferase involved in cell wall biosynthesis